MRLIFTKNMHQPLDDASVLIHIFKSPKQGVQAQLIYPTNGVIPSNRFDVGTVPDAIAAAHIHTQAAWAITLTGSPCIWVYSEVQWDEHSWGTTPTWG
ncbi:hypothetical protein [Paenochrobactrum pullorum]|uniref:hypothetical protein n=1 Tax=Paenochrobactrum pullorum TaxID=1324351 RepID=UPI0035BBEFE8